MAWISRLGALLGIIIALMVVAGYFAVKNHYALRQLDPTRVRELEHELGDLKLAYQNLESHKGAPPAAPETKAATDASAPPILTDSPETAPKTGESTSDTTASNVTLFSSFPSGTHRAPDFASPSIKIDSPRVTWTGSGKNLSVRFNILYVQEKGNQQGRILLIGRGPKTLVAYPDGAFNATGSDALISPDKGEYFSVSRFREVQAELGPVATAGSLREVEAILFNQYGQVLIHQIFPITAAAPKPAPKAPAPAPVPAPPAPAEPARGGEL